MYSELPSPKTNRERILQTAFWEIYKKGFHGASLATISENAGVTKGALFHHFRTKKALGLSVLNEVVGFIGNYRWIRLLKENADPIRALELILLFAKDQTPDEQIQFGCPFQNLVQEMSPVDADFQSGCQAFFDQWRRAIAQSLTRGMENQCVRADIDPEKVAVHVLASFYGAMTLGKSYQSTDVFKNVLDELLDYVRGLRKAA